ncbi:host specificity factor TipJ family phage tail protein [Anaerospora hongkongensis]|uniref:host specificity factor TipJ family phage tail protein n=1 Tax=Anaerospora hongkongensis TaxID=244830 RepID=UPI002FD99F39
MSKVTLVVLKNPFNTEGRQIYKLEFVPGKTIAQYVQPYTMGLDDFIYSAQGAKVEADYMPEPGDYLAACPMVGKSKILGSLLSIGLAVWTGGLAQGGFWGLKAGSFAASLAASAIAYVGGMVINHFFPPASPDMPDSTSSTPTYGWGNVSAQVMQGGVLARTFGTMKTAGTELTRYISVDGDKQYLNVLYTGGQGPIDDITDIQINGNPIENFTEVQVDTRLGTNDQTVIPNFGDTFASQNMNYELRDNEWSTQLTEGNAGEGLQVMVEFPNGLYHMNDNGGLENAWVRFASEYRIEGGEWVSWLSQSYVSSTSIEGATCYPDAPSETWTIKMSGLLGMNATVTGSLSGKFTASRKMLFDNGKIKCTIPSKSGTYTIIVANNEMVAAAQNTAVRRTFRIDNIPAGRYEVRMKVTSRSAATNSTRDSVRVYWNQLSQIIYDDFSRPNKILIGIRALATDQLNGNDIAITWKQHKETVLVWNPVSGQYEEKNARNAAWVAYDMVHGARQLVNIATDENEIVVDNVPASRMDYQAFTDWAARVDVLGLEFEHTFDSAADLWSALKAPEVFGRGKVIMKGTRFSCVTDKPSTPVQLFTVGNIDQGSFNKDYLGLTDRANAVEITFVNRDKGYQKDAFTIYGDDYNDSVVQNNPTQITLNGCTSYRQAYQHGKYLLRLNKYLLRTVTWDADIDAIACQIGDQVLLQHDVPEWGVGGRLVAATETTLTLDKPVTMEPGKTYGVYVRLIDDTLVNKYVVNTGDETNQLIVTTTFDEIPQEYDIFAFGEITKVAKPFSVVSVDRKDDLTYTLTGIEYVATVYEESLDAPVIEYSAEDMTPPEISGLSVAQETYRQKDGTVVSVINCSWLLPQRVVHSLVIYYREEGESTWKKWADQQEAFTTIAGVKSLSTYQVKVCAISDIGVISPGVISDPIYITGKDSPPSNVPSLGAAIDPADSTKVHLSWPTVTDIDLNGYQIMEGSTILTPNPISDTRYTYTATLSRQHAFAIRAVDNSGNASEVAATTTLNITIEPAQVAGFSIATQETDRSKLLLNWQANSEGDISYYEIRRGDNWSTAQVIATQLKATSYVHDLTVEGNQTYLIKAVNVAGYSSLNAAQKSIQVILRPDSPINLTAVQDPKDRSILVVSWSASPGKDISGYEIRRGNNWDTAVYVDTTRETSYRYTIPTSASFTIMVRSRTVAGYLSNVANVLTAPMIEAYDVTGFTAVQSMADRTKIRLMWDKPVSLDVAHYEIRKGAGWDTGVVVDSRVTGSFFDTTITTEGEHSYWIKAVTVAGKYSQNAAHIAAVFSLRPSPVSNIQVVQLANDKSVVVLTWDAIPESDLAGYQVKVGYVWDTAEALPLTKELSCTYNPAGSDNLKVMIKAVNAAGYFSDEVFTTYYAILEPVAVTGFQCLQNGEYVQFFWDKSPENDVVGYEIREGASFDNGTLIDTGITLNNHSVKVDVERNYRYHIKAINRSNRYSKNAAMQNVYVSNLPPKNVILAYDEIAKQDGIHSGTEFGLSNINWRTIGGSWSDYPTNKFDEIGGQNVLKLAKLPGGTYPATGSYLCEQIDIGQVTTCNIGNLFTSSVNLRGSGSAVLQIRVSQNGTDWTEWRDFKPAEYTFRYLERRVLLATEDPTKTPEVGQFSTRIDVPDTTQTGTVTVPAGGISVLYSKVFYTVPVVTSTAIGANRLVEITAENENGHTVKIVDRSGADVGGKYNYSAKGY